MADNTAGQTIVTGIDQATAQFATGKITYDATTITATDSTRVALGFKPRYVRWINLTDRVQVEWYEGMGSSANLKTVAAGTRTLDTTANGVVVDQIGFRILQDATLGAILASKVCYYEARG